MGEGMDQEPEDTRMFFGDGKVWLALVVSLGAFTAVYLNYPGFRFAVAAIAFFVLGYFIISDVFRFLNWLRRQ
jgi:hypothetical protein